MAFSICRTAWLQHLPKFMGFVSATFDVWIFVLAFGDLVFGLIKVGSACTDHAVELGLHTRGSLEV